VIENFVVLVQISFRNLFSSFINLIIGAIILVGTAVLVVGSSMLDSFEGAMSKSITGSLTGHVQLYSAASKDELAIYGGSVENPQLSPIADFPKVKRLVSALPNVKAVVPMGFNGAMLTSGNTIDLTLAKLRDTVKARDAAKAAGEDLAAVDAQVDSQKAHVRQIVKVLAEDAAKATALVDAKAIDPEMRAALTRVSGDPFWADFDRDPYQALELLENEIAPLMSDADMVFVRYAGTDLDAFQRSFDRMRIVDGTPVPPGKRGFLFPKFEYEERLKLKTARRLDKMKEALTGSGRTIAADKELQRYVRENQVQTREIVLQLDGIKTRQAIERLNAALGANDDDLPSLLTRLFTTDDANFLERYRIFYEQLAPLLELYKLRVGDMLTIKSFTRAGYVQSVAVKIYGTFEFSGLEKSPLAGVTALMDLMTFRDLYGYLSADKIDEIRRLQAASGAKQVDRANAEAELFGGGANVVSEATQANIDEKKELTGKAKAERTEDLVARVYTPDEIDDGVVLNAAILLEDPLQLKTSLRALVDLSEREKLGLKVVPWAEASGNLGSMVMGVKAALYLAVAIIFIVAVVVINNALMMATLQRAQTIGTMRAIGAQRSFVLTMVLLETTVLALLFGTGGAALGAGLMSYWHAKGIGANSDALYFFFSGPRLYPTMGAGNLLTAFVIVLVVSVVSTLYPALIAMRVSPVTAMQSEE
jgi:ABC-type lipoprotein release transport system permease subunit